MKSRLFKMGDIVKSQKGDGYSDDAVGVINKDQQHKNDIVYVTLTKAKNKKDVGRSIGYTYEELELITIDVTNPSHYKLAPGVEVIQLTEQLPFLEGNIVKYVCRHKNKNGLEDLKKARWYLDRLIKNLETNND